MDLWIIGPCRLVFHGRHIRTGVKRGDPTLIKAGSNLKSRIINSLLSPRRRRDISANRDAYHDAY